MLFLYATKNGEKLLQTVVSLYLNVIFIKAILVCLSEPNHTELILLIASNYFYGQKISFKNMKV